MTRSLKIAVTGASGMLGTALLDHFANEFHVFATSRRLGYTKEGINWQLFDLLDKEKLINWLNTVRPDVVVHCAAMVNVDACEQDLIKAKALHVETTATIVKNISCWNGRLIYISTDSVFDGAQKGLYNEDMQPNPLNIYAHTKHEGEITALAIPGNTVLRTNIFGWSQAERYSFAEWILKGLIEKAHFSIFTDVNFTPIHVSHVAEVIAKLITSKNNISGLFHLTGSSMLSKYDFTLKMAAEFNLSTDNIIPTSIDQVVLTAARPKNMALSNLKLSNILKYSLPTVDEGIAYLKAQYHNGWLAKIKKRTIESNYHFWSVT